MNRTYPPVGPRKYRLGSRLMTREEAIAIRAAHLEGKPVLALELQEAVRVLSKQRGTAKAAPARLAAPGAGAC